MRRGLHGAGVVASSFLSACPGQPEKKGLGLRRTLVILARPKIPALSAPTIQDGGVHGVVGRELRHGHPRSKSAGSLHKARGNRRGIDVTRRPYRWKEKGSKTRHIQPTNFRPGIAGFCCTALALGPLLRSACRLRSVSILSLSIASKAPMSNAPASRNGRTSCPSCPFQISHFLDNDRVVGYLL